MTETPTELRNKAKQINNNIYNYYLTHWEGFDKQDFEKFKSKINKNNINKITNLEELNNTINIIINKYRAYFEEPKITTEEEYAKFMHKINKYAKNKESAPTQQEQQQPTEEPEEETPIEGINKTMQREPLRNKGDIHNNITSGEPIEEPKTNDTKEQQAPKDAEQSEQEQQEEPETNETGAPTDARNEVRIIHRETNLSTNEIMENYNKIIDEFYKDNDAEKYFKRIRYLTIMLPDNKFEEIAEEEATKLAQMNINGVKLFNDISEARQFLYDLRYGRNRTFKGQHQRVYKLPKLQRMIKQSNQTNQTISPMMSRNIKPLTRTNYIYEY